MSITKIKIVIAMIIVDDDDAYYFAVCLFVGWLVGWLVGWFWLVGWLFVCLLVCLFVCMTACFFFHLCSQEISQFLNSLEKPRHVFLDQFECSCRPLKGREVALQGHLDLQELGLVSQQLKRAVDLCVGVCVLCVYVCVCVCVCVYEWAL